MGIFQERESAIRGYIEDHIFEYLTKEGFSDFDAYINDFLDFDKYKQKKILFYNFGSYYIQPLTNETDSGQFTFDIFMAFRGDTPENLRNMMLGHASCIYEMFRDSGFNFGGAVDGQMSAKVDFYNAGEGNPNLKVCAMTFQTMSEI